MIWTTIKPDELGLVMRNKTVLGILEPGSHFVPSTLRGNTIARVSTKEPVLISEHVLALSRYKEIGKFAEVVTIGQQERGMLWVDKQFTAVLEPGVHVVWKVRNNIAIELIDVSNRLLATRYAEILADLPLLSGVTKTVRLKDFERALVWVDGRLAYILSNGTHLLWTILSPVELEVFNITEPAFEHAKLSRVLEIGSSKFFKEYSVPVGHVGLLYIDGKRTATLKPARYAFWLGGPAVNLINVDLLSRSLEISGQELMTFDRVTLRLNATLVLKTTDPILFKESADNADQALYRDAQLILRATVSSRDLDGLLQDKTVVTEEMLTELKAKALAYGVEVTAFGIRDIILPGEMKTLLNKVVEAQKIAKAALIHRREETAAMRSQMNTAKLMENNPTLVRMRELETLEKVTANANLTVVLAESESLTTKVMSLL